MPLRFVMMVHYGLVGTFVVDREMTIRTVRVTASAYEKMLRRSIFYLLGWCQRAVLLSDRGFALKERLCQGLHLDYDLNKYLLSFFESMKVKYAAKTIPSCGSRGRYALKDINEGDIAITPYQGFPVEGTEYAKGATKYLIFVKLDGKSKAATWMPLLCINDI